MEFSLLALACFEFGGARLKYDGAVDLLAGKLKYVNIADVIGLSH